MWNYPYFAKEVFLVALVGLQIRHKCPNWTNPKIDISSNEDKPTTQAKQTHPLHPTKIPNIPAVVTMLLRDFGVAPCRGGAQAAADAGPLVLG